MNKVILMGRLTRDPDIRYTQPNSAQEQTWHRPVDQKDNVGNRYHCTVHTGTI